MLSIGKCAETKKYTGGCLQLGEAVRNEGDKDPEMLRSRALAQGPELETEPEPEAQTANQIPHLPTAPATPKSQRTIWKWLL